LSESVTNLTSTNKHILILASWYPNKYSDKAGNFNRRYARWLAKKHIVSVIHVEFDKNNTQNAVYDIDTSEGFITVRAYVPRKKGLFGKIFNQFSYYQGCWEAYKIVKEKGGKVDLCHNMVLWKMGWFAYKLFRKEKIPYIVTEHSTGFYPDHNSYRPFQKRVMSKVLRNAKWVTAVSNTLLGHLSKLHAGANTSVVPNIVLKPDFTLPGDVEKAFVHVSRLDNHQKNVFGIVDAFAEALKVEPEMKLHFIGHGEGRIPLVNYVRSKGVEDKVKFRGDKNHKNLLDLLGGYTALVNFSNYESYSIVCAEALATGLPVIYTACGGPEEFMSEETGIEVEIGNIDSLKEAMLSIYKGETSFDRQSLINSFDKTFDNNKIVDDFTAIYEKAMN
jgi:glycosyltransferase involved in cell wall biosynthesis